MYSNSMYMYSNSMYSNCKINIAINLTFCPNAWPNRLIASVLASALANIADDSPKIEHKVITTLS